MNVGTSGDLGFYMLKGRPKEWKGDGELISGWDFSKALVLLVGLEFISVVSDTNFMTGMIHE